MHKKRLGASSIVFEDMFEIGSGGGVAEVPVAESSEVLEAVLPYCYPVRNPAFDLTRPCAVDVIRTFDKYDVSHPSRDWPSPRDPRSDRAALIVCSSTVGSR